MRFRAILLLSRFRLSGVALGVLAPEALDATRGVHKLLLAGKKGMASGADFHGNIALVSRAGDKCIAAGAMHANFSVIRMDGCFHVDSYTSIQPLDSTGVRKDSATLGSNVIIVRKSECQI